MTDLERLQCNYTINLLGLFGGSESTRPLLVHLSSGGDSVYGHVEETSGANDIEDTINVLKNGLHHFIFVFRGCSVRVCGCECVQVCGWERCAVVCTCMTERYTYCRWVCRQLEGVHNDLYIPLTPSNKLKVNERESPLREITGVLIISVYVLCVCVCVHVYVCVCVCVCVCLTCPRGDNKGG